MQVYNNTIQSGLGASSVIIPFNSQSFTVGQLVGQPITSLGIVCTVSPGANLVYSVQVTADIPNAFVNWVDHSTMSDQNASVYGQIIYPVSGIRLNITSWVSGNVNMGIVQWP